MNPPIISRHIRQADSVDSVGFDANNHPYIQLNIGAGGIECNETILSAATVVELKLNKTTSELQCTTNPGTGSAQVMLQPVSNVSFGCRNTNSSGQLVTVSNADCEANATAVLVTISVKNDSSTPNNVQSFLVTLRNKSLKLSP